MGMSGYFLRDNEKLDLEKLVEDTKSILDKIGYLYEYSHHKSDFRDEEHTISVVESEDLKRGFLMYLYGKSEEIVHEFDGYGGKVVFDEIKEGVVWATAIVIEDFSESKDMMLRFAYEYFKLFPQDIFYDELAWYHTKEYFDDILELPYNEFWCYWSPETYP